MKLYRFEKLQSPNQPNAQAAPALANDQERHEAIMAELAALRAHICPPSEDGEVAPNALNSLAANGTLAEAFKLKAELDQIYGAIDKTKREIASISSAGHDHMITRPMDELDAVVAGTESATNQILTAIENIDKDASQLADTLTGDAGLQAANIQENIISIYEACNFQDITGQRIAKVVSVLKFISERTDKMIEIWGGIESFNTAEVEKLVDERSDATLLNGPALETDEEVVSQDDIDALFG